MSSTPWIAGLLRAASAIGCLLASATGSGVAGADCDRNGIPDDVDIASGTSPDCDSNGVPDACDLSPTWLGPVGPRHVFLPGMPSSAALADLDLDGVLDAAVACYDSGRVAILRGCGDGTFDEPVLYPAGHSLNSMASGDWNSDGFLDLAACSGHLEQVFVFLGNGDGSFQAATAFPTGANPLVLVARDFDLDGDLDLVTGSDYESPWNISILPGDGAGSFGPPTILSANPAKSCAVGDFDDDGLLDFAAAIGGAFFTVYFGRESGPLATGSAVSTDGTVLGLATADLDGDGILDVAAACPDRRRVLLFHGRGDGTFSRLPPLDFVHEPAELLLSDANGDGTLDVVASSLDTLHYDLDMISVSLGRGQGQFDAPVYYRGGGYVSDMELGDLDGDGVADLVAVNGAPSGFTVLLGGGDGIFPTVPAFAASGHTWRVRTADFDGDGHVDVVATSLVDGSLSVLLGTGEGTLGASRNRRVGARAGEPLPVDLDRDGAVDVVVPIDDPPEIVILRGDGTGTFLEPIRYTVPGYPLRASAGDVDGDGDIDLFVVAAGRPHLYFLVAGPPAVPFVVRELPTGNDSVDCAILVDLDGDGIVDVAAGGTGVVGIFRGNGDGTFRDRAPVPVGDPADESVVALAASDLDRDGRLDLAAALRLDGYDASRRDRIAVLRGTEGGALGPPEYRFVRVSPSEIVVTDLDGDGIGDLGVANRQSSSISLLPGNGDATFGPEICVPVSQGAEGLAAGDFDEDGFGDLAVASLGWGESTRGMVSLVLGRRGPPALADCDSNGVPDSCDIASGAVSDVDSDGIPDRCEGGLRVPGDCNEDGATNISDAICTLGVLFLGSPPEFPCGDGGPGDPGNAALLGWQGSASVSVSDAIGLLRFLFLDGPPHPAAAPVAPSATCVPFAGCTSSAGCR